MGLELGLGLQLGLGLGLGLGFGFGFGFGFGSVAAPSARLSSFRPKLLPAFGSPSRVPMRAPTKA